MAEQNTLRNLTRTKRETYHASPTTKAVSHRPRQHNSGDTPDRILETGVGSGANIRLMDSTDNTKDNGGCGPNASSSVLTIDAEEVKVLTVRHTSISLI